MNIAKRTKNLAIFAALILVIFIYPLTIKAEGEAVTLTIIHVNDRHGRMDADPYISQFAKDIKGNVLILDGGDALHGQITANLSEGEAMVTLMNDVDYQAMVVGNHDFNYGLERLAELEGMMDFPLLSANITTSDGELLFKPYEIFVLEGITVGVFGVSTPETLEKTNPKIVAGLSFGDPTTVAADMVSKLQEKGCDIIVALIHLGVDSATVPEQQSYAVAAVPGVDVVIDGHSHTAITEPVWVGDTLIAQTGWAAENIGVVEITIREGEMEKSSYLIPSPYESLQADESIAAKINELNEKNEAITSVVVGYTPVFLQGDREFVRREETNLSNLVTDSMKWATGADVAFLTGGNIRESIDTGDITMGHVLTVLPFSNLLVTVEVLGSDLLQALEHGVSDYPELAGSFIQVAGLSFTFDPNAEPGQRVLSVTMADGSLLEPDKIYIIATNEYLADGGDAEAFASYLATNPEMKAEAEGRIQAVTADAKENPQTGDDGWMYIPALTMALALALIFILLCVRRKKSKN